jgi:hypothetical protein
MEFVWIVLVLVGFGIPIVVSQLLVQHALERKGNWLTFVELLNGVFAFTAGIALLYVLITGAGALWDRSGWAFVISVGTVPFVIYFYIAKVNALESEKRKRTLTPKQAERIVQRYGAALARGCPDGGIARYESYLPCSKGKIKQAVKLVLAFQIEYSSLEKEPTENLLQAISCLNSFVPEEKANQINKGDHGVHNTLYWDFIKTMVSLEIREEIDNFIQQVRQLDQDDPLFHQRVYTLIGLEYSPSIEKDFYPQW